MDILKKALIPGSTLLVGFISGTMYEKHKKMKDIPIGTLRLDQSEADEPTQLFLELEVPLESLQGKKVAVFRVVKQNYISRK